MTNNHRETLITGRGATNNSDINMNFGFFFTMAFLVLGLVRGCTVDVAQPTELIRRKEQQSVSIPCSVNISSCQHTELQISWYVFRKDHHYQIDVSRVPLKYKLERHDLKISSLTKADCGVYYCAAALLTVAHSGAQAMGQGTTLKVSERGLNIRQALLLTLLVLLIVYSLLVLGLIICIKTGQFKSFFKRRWCKNKNKEDSTKQALFSGVVQELCKRNLSGDEIQARYRVSQDKSEGLQDVNHSEDVYQNLDE